MTATPNTTSPEIWRPVPEWDGLYEVSDRGRVRRNPTARGRGAKPGRVLRPNVNGPSSPYQWVTLYRDGIGRIVYVHRVVAAAFLLGGPAPVVRHRDNDPANNVPANLAWGTQADNVQDMISAGRADNGRRARTHCPQDHPYDAANTRTTKRGGRACRACERDRARAAYVPSATRKAA